MLNILLITNSHDVTVTYFINKFSDKANFYRFNFDEYQNYKITLSNHEWIIESSDYRVDISDIHSIYYRKPLLPNLEEYDPLFHDYMKKEMSSLITGIIEGFTGFVLTKPSTLLIAENKIVQLKLAQEVGFNIPLSLITNDNYAADSFCTSIKPSIVKPLSCGRIRDNNNDYYLQTNLVDKFNNGYLNMSPAYFQEYKNKDFELRVTVVDQIFNTVKIESDNKVDWRKFDSNNTYTVSDLPDDLKYKCLEMMQELNICFGAFDFIVKNSEYYFLEVNPNGQWLWLEEQLDLNISNQIFSKLKR